MSWRVGLIPGSRSLVLGLALLGLAGCGHAPSVPETQYHQLSRPEPLAQAGKPLLQLPVRVDNLVSDDLRQDRAWVYSAAPPHLSLQESHLHYWVDTPGRLLQAYLRDFLVAQGIASPAMLSEAASDGYWVKGEILRLERELEPDGEFVHVELELRLGQVGAERALVYGRFADRRAVGTGVEPGVGPAVLAFSEAVSQVCLQFVQAIRTQADKLAAH